MKMLLAACAVVSLALFGCAAGSVDSSDSSESAPSPADVSKHAEGTTCADYCLADYQECMAGGAGRVYCANAQRVCMNTCRN